MIKSEFKKLVAKSPNKEFLDNLSISITFQKIGEPILLKSLVDFYDFVFDQYENWKGAKSFDTGVCDFQRYKEVLTTLDDQIQNHLNSPLDSRTVQNWKNSNLGRHLEYIYSYCSDYNDIRCQVILDISNEYGSEAGMGAFYYFKNTSNVSSLNLNHLKGFIVAYELDLEKKSGIFSRTKKEIQGINKINEKYHALVTELNSQHVDHLKVANDDLKAHLEETEAFKNEKEKLFNDWYSKTQKTNTDFEKESRNRIFELEEFYEKKLQLQAPAKYWDKKSKEYYRQAILTRDLLTFIIGLFAALFASILVFSPDWIFKTVFDNNKIAIVRWSIVFIALISLLIFIIKAITKVMFSAFHLARDAEERHTLTFFYLALLNDPKSEIKDEERKLIIQSLFSRADTGLLKGDSSPEMPNDFLGKIMGKS
ncbi:MAG: hypothetical protein K9I84_06475 [Leadbetterella sp.]|nr:hypothetical protein [Leadbetterella sp.]